MILPKHIKSILDRLDGAGFDAYVVGGSLRDALLGRDANDWDIASSALPDEVISLFSDKHVIPTGLKHGTVTVISDGEPVEITTFRIDGEYSDLRHPESVSFARRVEDDLARRDFTVNAMAYNEKRGLVDLFGGQHDLKSKIIRCVGDPEKRFQEDALRIMRAFRFASQLGFEIHPDTLNAAHKMGGGLESVARERIGAEFLRLIGGREPSGALLEMGSILNMILPISIDTQRIETVSALECDAVSRLAFLLCGATDERLNDASHLLRLSSKQEQRLKKLTSPPTKDELDGLTPSGARRILANYGEDSVNAAKISVLLYGSDGNSVALLRRIEEEHPCISLSDLAISGTDLIKENIAEGKLIGEILHALLDAVIEAPSLNERQALLDLAKRLSK